MISFTLPGKAIAKIFGGGAKPLPLPEKPPPLPDRSDEPGDFIEPETAKLF